MKQVAAEGQVTRVLVIDDEDDVRNLLRRALQRANFEVVGEAADGAAGAELAGVLQPDVVILDSNMPILGGEEAAVLIRQQAPSAAIIAFSGALRVCPEWADAYLNKGSGGLIASLIAVVGVATMGSAVR